jgi:formylmethanofuran dehydrogenase subunit E
MDDLQRILDESSARHRHLCPRQVLGARIGLAGAAVLGLETRQRDRRLLVILETDGCFAGAVEIATGCSVDQRTLRVVDYGKVAATVIDVRSETALRLAPRPGIRLQARCYAPEEPKLYYAQLVGYQRMPVDELLAIRPIVLQIPARRLLSRAGARVECQVCGEEIINQREIRRGEQILCRACAGEAYYTAETFAPFDDIFNSSKPSTAAN